MKTLGIEVINRCMYGAALHEVKLKVNNRLDLIPFPERRKTRRMCPSLDWYSLRLVVCGSLGDFREIPIERFYRLVYSTTIVGFLLLRWA